MTLSPSPCALYSDRGSGVGEEAQGGTAQFRAGSGSQETQDDGRRAASVRTMYAIIIIIIIIIIIKGIYIAQVRKGHKCAEHASIWRKARFSGSV